jgi:ribonuclease HI
MSESLEEFLKSLNPESVVEVFTDGACSGNPGPGGWGAVLRHASDEAEVFGGEAQTTNNRMEMLAAINGVSYLPHQTKVTLYTDSQYLKDGVTRWMINWKKNGWLTADKKPVKNRDLWERLDQLIKTHTIEWQWVRGHDGHVENERADALARKGIIAQRMAM